MLWIFGHPQYCNALFIRKMHPLGLHFRYAFHHFLRGHGRDVRLRLEWIVKQEWLGAADPAIPQHVETGRSELLVEDSHSAVRLPSAGNQAHAYQQALTKGRGLPAVDDAPPRGSATDEPIPG